MSTQNNMPQSETWLIASGNQGLASGTLFPASGSSSSIAAGQLGIVNWDNGSHLAKGTFLTATNNAAGTGVNTKTSVGAIKLIQGTANSANFSGLDALSNVYSEPSYIASQIIYGDDKIEFVGTASNVGRRSAFVAGAAVAGTTSIFPVDDTEFTMHVAFHSTRRNKIFGTRNTDMVTLSTLTPTFADIGLTTKASKVDWIIQNLVFDSALRSGAVNLVDYPGANNKPFVAFAVDLDGGGTGTALSAIVAGTPFNFVTKNGVTYSYTPDAQFVATITESIANSSLLTTSEIGVVDLSTAGAQLHDAILVVALDENINGVVTDKEVRQKVRLQVSMNKAMYQASNNTYLVESSRYIDPQGVGRNLQIMYSDRAKKQVWSEQEFGTTREFLTSPDYINEAGTYNMFTIYSDRNWVTDEGRTEHRGDVTTILIPSTTAGVGSATTVTALNTVLQPWLDSVGYKNKITDASGGALFV
jgi:hypothetical protein